MSSLSDALLEFFYPTNATCMGCNTLLGTDGSWLCEACRARLRPMHESERARCPICGHFLTAQGRCRCCSRWEEKTLTLVRSAYVFQGPARGVVHRLKYRGVRLLAPSMANDMAQTLLAEDMPLPDAFVPVPMTARRERMRGYNQSRLLAEELSGITHVPLLDALTRLRANKQNARLSAAQRRENMRGAFSCIGDVSGMRLMLVDDVFTTGATSLACAKALLEKGAEEVTLITFAAAE